MSASPRRAARARVAVISLHTSPLDQPGTGDSGGMNVYVRSVADHLGRRGVAVDVYTRCAGRRVPEVDYLGPLTRVIQIPAGPCATVPKLHLPELVPGFARTILDRAAAEGAGYDLVHAHYWLSGVPGIVAAERWGVPLVASFHTLGRVKNLTVAPGDVPEPAERIADEDALIGAADRILAPTPAEAAHLIELYRAAPARIRLVPPGVDGSRFRPQPKEGARRALGLDGARVAMFLGRLQPVKGPDLAVEAVAEAVRGGSTAARDLVLAVVGGPSGGSGSDDPVGRLRQLARERGVADRVRFFDPRPHQDLPALYAAADAILVPSRSESFGLVALEAQACGVPVVAAAVGGLRHVVADGESGVLVDGHDPAAYAEALLAVLRDPALGGRLSSGAVVQAMRFPWEATAERMVAVYEELVPALARESVA